jgi:hypothetical protein
MILALLLAMGVGATDLNMAIEYTTDGVVYLDIMNMTFHTTYIHVTLLGCDDGYYDYYALFPPAKSWKTEVTPYHCLECACARFEPARAEDFF